MSSVSYWKGSAPSKQAAQVTDTYQFTKVTVFKVQAIPDFASGRFRKMEHLEPAARVGFIAGLQKSLLKGMAYFSQTQYENSNGAVVCGYSLKILYSPEKKSSGAATAIYLVGRVSTNVNSALANALQTKQHSYIKSLLTSQLYRFAELPVCNAWIPQWLSPVSSSPSCYEVIKSEEVLQWLDEEDSKFFYSPGDFQVNKGNDMIALFEQLQAYKREVCVDITLVPTVVEGYEKKVISRYIEALTKASRGIGEEEIDPDSNTQKAKLVYENIKKQYYLGTVFLYSFRAFSPCEDTCHNVANILAACGTAGGMIPRIVEVNDRDYAKSTMLSHNINEKACFRGIWDLDASLHNIAGFSAPQTLKRLHRLLTLDEASAFFRFPIPLNQPCSGIAYDTGTSRFSTAKSQPAGNEYVKESKTIDLGTFYRNQPTDEVCEFDIEQLKTHMLIVGGSGSGKTTTTFNILYQLWEKHKIPFIVFDPKITPEYRYLKKLKSFKDDLLIFTPGQELIAPFRMNPFEVIEDIPVQEHISRVFDCFIGALPVEDPLPSFIMKAIDKAYEDKGWDIAYSRGQSQATERALAFPSMEELRTLALEFAQKNYGKDRQIGDRVKGALDTRLYRLTSNSGVAKMFRTLTQLPLKTLMTKPIVFELGGLNEEEQALFSLFILTFIFEYVRTERVGKFLAGEDTEERATDLNLRHVILVEEAHNILGQNEDSSGGSSSQVKVIDKFAQIMREMRSAGEGVIVVDQSPAALSRSIVDATNLKLMHRLPSPDDREYLGRAMCLSEGETKVSGIFSAGQGFYYVPGWDRAQRVDTTNFKETNLEVSEVLKSPMPDSEVAESMRSQVSTLFDVTFRGSPTRTLRSLEEIASVKKRIASLIDILKNTDDNDTEIRQGIQEQIDQERKSLEI